MFQKGCAEQEGPSEQKALLGLTNEIPELVYVADTETYELLFLNKSGKEKFALSNPEGQECYRVLQGLDAPCPFCTNDRLNQNETYTWQHYNPITNSHYMLKDKLIEWNGRLVRLEIAFDITRQENERQMLSSSLEAERVLMDCVRELYDTADTSSALNHVLRQVGTYLEADRAYLVEAHGNTLFGSMEWHSEGTRSRPLPQKGGEHYPLEGWKPYFLKQQCAVVEDIEELRESLPEEYAQLKEQGIHSIIFVPLDRRGSISGYIGVDNPAPDKLRNIATLFQTLRYFIMSSFHRAENEERLTRLSYYDTLTGIYNRNRFMQDTKALAGTENIGVVELNVNGLKSINDSQGHAAGDSVLVECAQRMICSFGRADFYRIGGDEFVIICRGIPRADFEGCVRKLQELLAANDVCSAAIGAKWAEYAESPQPLLAEAAERMYNDKKRFYRMTLSADRYRYYNDDVLGLTKPEFLASELKKGNFLLYLQPKIAFLDRCVVGAEALVRYRTEDGTVISPQQFLPLLEDARLISEVDFFMFEAVCACIASWRERGLRIVPVAVNFSRYTLVEKDFTARLEACCRRYGVSKKLLEIEITESVEGVGGFDIRQCINNIRDLGFLVSIDDFGARYANMYLFASAEFDVLKIDKSLVDDVAVNENVLQMLEVLGGYCGRLRIETVAEGVETEEQFRLLRSIGIKQAQGFLFSRPIPVAEYEEKFLSGERM